ncbi:hypothetical protein [Limnohabitans sp. Bal53]|uniref:hypothetical protein n=1 Tax=Limnohabitans sp. Bal53 TaxID=1977910 RepID=UPI001304F125|nr:hypothetical protein [Limnohabitans sp. Bal53]
MGLHFNDSFMALARALALNASVRANIHCAGMPIVGITRMASCFRVFGPCVQK